VPLVHSDFMIGQRVLEASRKHPGSDLQTDSVTAATEAVAERLVILTVNRIIAGLPGLSEAVRLDCRHTQTLARAAEAAEAARAAAAARAARAARAAEAIDLIAIAQKAMEVK